MDNTYVITFIIIAVIAAALYVIGKYFGRD